MHGCSFQQLLRQIWVGLRLNTGKRFFLGIGSSKKDTSDFQNSPPFERLTCFYVTISGIFERFQYFNFKTDFLEYENLFQKTGV